MLQRSELMRRIPFLKVTSLNLMARNMQIPKAAAALPLLLCLAGCKMEVLNPSGDLAVQERDLVILATGLMLLIIVPVIIMTLLFAWRYRASNTAAPYRPDWHHSTRLELAIWGAPIAIIAVLGSVAWAASHTLDPYRPISRIAPGRPVTAATKPLEVQVVAMDWKWLFIYPELGVATVNELAAPVDRPLAFKITSTSAMNSFYVPAMAGQIYAMPGMQTQLHAVINKPGVYEGFSANYSGAGFSDMRFKLRAMSAADFNQWVAAARSANGPRLLRADYQGLAKPSIAAAKQTFAQVEPGLFDDIVGGCALPGQVCRNGMTRSENMALKQDCKKPEAAAAASKVSRRPSPTPAA